MINRVDLLKLQGRALSAYLLIGEGFCLPHARSLHAVAAMYGFRDWDSLSRAILEDRHSGASAIVGATLSEQAASLANHLFKHYGFQLEEPDEAVAAIRWGALAHLLTDMGGDSLRAHNWLNAPHPEFGGQSVREMVRTDMEYERVERLLHQTT